MSARVRQVLMCAVIATSYVVTARIGFTMASVAEQVTVVWAPSGIALAACLLFGRSAWPGVWLGAFLANVTSHEPLPVAAAIATGNLLEAVAGRWLLEHVGGFDVRIGRLQDVLALGLLGAGISSMVSATIGALTLCANGLQPWTLFSTLWTTWWTGDAIGDLVVAPVVLGWAAVVRRPHWSLLRIGEALLLLCGLVGVSYLAFGYNAAGFVKHYPLGYTVFPLLIWAAVRFGLVGTAMGVLIASTTAIWLTVQGTGPFAGGSQSDNLILVQMFMGVVAVTTLLLGAAIQDRVRGKAIRSAEYRVAQTISAAESLEEAAPRILKAICLELEWDLGAFWRVDPDRERIRCLELWQRPRLRAPQFVARTRAASFLRGVGLPGRVWATGMPYWASNVTKDPNFPRAPVAAKEGLHGGFAFPVVLEREVVAVVEFFSREMRQPDAEMLGSFSTIGFELGQFIGRLRNEAVRREAEEALKEADRRKDEFLATLAHELRNPLAPVRNAVEILRLIGPAGSKVDWASEIIERQVKHLARLVDDLFDMARVTTGKVTLEREIVEVSAIVASAVERVRLEIERRGHRLVLSVPEDPILVDADHIRLSQVLANLLDNAAKYTEDGGEISLSVERTGQEVAIRVRDTGIGMRPDMLPVVFDLFSQGDRSIDRANGGLGIGLSLVRRFVEMHDGSVEATSEGPGRGSEFLVRLPVVSDDRARPPELTPAPRPSAAARKVLVVDDNVDSAESVREILSMEGHDVRTVHDGSAALEAARASVPEVVVLDIGLPGIDGYEVAELMRRDGRFADVLLIALTAYGREEDRRRAAAAGFDVHMTKPVAPDALRVIVARGRA